MEQRHNVTMTATINRLYIHIYIRDLYFQTTKLEIYIFLTYVAIATVQQELNVCVTLKPEALEVLDLYLHFLIPPQIFLFVSLIFKSLTRPYLLA